MDEQHKTNVSPKRIKEFSKFLSYVLRHNPQTLGLELDPAGWVEVDLFLARINEKRSPVTMTDLQTIVETNDKRRYEFSQDGKRIRAVQGHSVHVDLGYTPLTPPETLYHGTAECNLESILRDGLRPGSRQYVHLSPDIETATKVGARHGNPVVLNINAASMHQNGHLFYRAPNGVWLVMAVPALFLSSHFGTQEPENPA